MLRWLLLILLLCNALLFLWYAQRQPGPDEVIQTNSEVASVRLLHELSGTEVGSLSRSECYQLGVFASAQEATQAGSRLDVVALTVVQRKAPETLAGYQLVIDMPSDGAAQLELLDKLALAGWVPQTQQGRFLLGPFAGERANSNAKVEQRALNEALGLVSELEPIMAESTAVVLDIEVPAGTEIGQASRQLLLNGWPGIKIEKKSCAGLARPQSYQ